jgi:peptidoglycan/xylan/chitin deacetylase (PgdA/CDA1 family)
MDHSAQVAERSYRKTAPQSLSERVLASCFQGKVFDGLHALWPPRLTVLAYHRIADPHAPEFDTFKPNVSATPEAFAEQMDFIQRRFNVISIEKLIAWLHGADKLPPNPALITFDDGYRDNFIYGLPILRQHNLPAVIFLATDYINQANPFYWDLVAYCFHHTTRTEAELPALGPQQWPDADSRFIVMRQWLNHLKTLSDDEKWAAVNKLPGILAVTVPAEAFAALHLTWEQVRTLVKSGVDMGAHTQSHPILTRVSLDQAQQEIIGSKTRIEQEIDRPVRSFAYPNGLADDFSEALQAIMPQAGIEAAFTLLAGPTPLREARRAPFIIRRVFIHYKDTLPRFAAKVMGLPRLLKSLG